MYYIDQKYLLLVSSQLKQFKKKNDGLYNFRCPYCGDSKKSQTKARGFMFRKENSMIYKCHNCGVGASLKNFLKPPLGVYISRLKIISSINTEISNVWLPSISNIGTRPTVSGDSINLETHIIDFKNNAETNLYGRRINVELIEFLRPEKKFNSLSELKKQIEVDTKKAFEFHK